MIAADSGPTAERAGPDLSFLERSPPRASDIPNLARSGSDIGGENRSRHGEGRVLTIGSGITVSGAISACDTLVVEGKVEADLTAGRKLDIARGGVYCGRAEVDSATIAGAFEGDLTVHGRLQIAATGHVTGTVRYSKLEIEAGGELDGTVSVAAPTA
jgi:cytoskeletal protein CcmA (bactofilin family)